MSFLVLLPIFLNLYGARNQKFKKRWIRLKLSFSAVIDFLFRMKSDERSEVFRNIYKLYPKFVHIDFLNFRVLMAYDPEIVKR